MDDTAPASRDGTPPRTRLWRGGRLARENFPITEVGEILRDPDSVIWVDIRLADQADLTLINKELGFDPLAVEDALTPRERSKVDRYRNHLFLNVYSVSPRGEDLALSEVSAFVTDQALITVRDHVDFDMNEVVRRWDAGSDLAVYGVAYLLHGLLDVVVDQHFATIQALDDEAEALEDLLFEEAHPDRRLQRRSFRLRKNLSTTRRIVLPLREVVNTLMRRDLHVIPEPMGPYFQDVYDHVLRATEWTENLRDLTADIMETRIALQGNHLNEVMKKVTSWAAIIAVPTAVTGYYGQNLPYPGSETHWGFAVSTVLIATLGIGLYVVFKKRDWL